MSAPSVTDAERAVERALWLDKRQRQEDRQGNLAMVGAAIMALLAVMCLLSIAGGSH